MLSPLVITITYKPINILTIGIYESKPENFLTKNKVQPIDYMKLYHVSLCESQAMNNVLIQIDIGITECQRLDNL